MIKKTDKGYVVYSEKGKPLSKPYKTKEEAEKRLNETPYIHIDSKIYETIEALDHEADEKARLLSSLRED